MVLTTLQTSLSAFNPLATMSMPLVQQVSPLMAEQLYFVDRVHPAFQRGERRLVAGNLVAVQMGRGEGMSDSFEEDEMEEGFEEGEEDEDEEEEEEDLYDDSRLGKQSESEDEDKDEKHEERKRFKRAAVEAWIEDVVPPKQVATPEPSSPLVKSGSDVAASERGDDGGLCDPTSKLSSPVAELGSSPPATRDLVADLHAASPPSSPPRSSTRSERAAPSGAQSWFTKLPKSVRHEIYTWFLCFQGPRTVSTAAVKWHEGIAYDHNEPVALFQIWQETFKLKDPKTEVGTTMHGYVAFDVPVLTCSEPLSYQAVRFVINPKIDMLYITDNYLTASGALMPGLGSTILNSLHNSTLLSSIQQLTLCCHDQSFPLLISQLGHFTNLKLLFLVTGTHYVRPSQASLTSSSTPSSHKDRFDAQQPNQTIYYAPHSFFYLPSEFLSLIIRPAYSFRTHRSLPLPGGKLSITVPCEPELPIIKVVSRTEWIKTKPILWRVRARMSPLSMAGRGHRVMSETRFEQVWLGREEVDYWKRQVRGRDGKPEQRFLGRVFGRVDAVGEEDVVCRWVQGRFGEVDYHDKKRDELRDEGEEKEVWKKFVKKGVEARGNRNGKGNENDERL